MQRIMKINVAWMLCDVEQALKYQTFKQKITLIFLGIVGIFFLILFSKNTREPPLQTKSLLFKNTSIWYKKASHLFAQRKATKVRVRTREKNRMCAISQHTAKPWHKCLKQICCTCLKNNANVEVGQTKSNWKY